jgi:hypothetical protein
MGRLHVLSSRGDTQVTWDQKKAAEGDPEAIEAIREAERIFQEERAKGSTAFRVATDKPAERIDAFDEKAEQIVMVPKVAGGACS